MEKKGSTSLSSSSASAGQKTTTHVTFVCQRCSQPIKLNKSLQAKALVNIAKNVQEKLAQDWSGDEEEREGRGGPSEPPTDQLDGEMDDLGPMTLERSSPAIAKTEGHTFFPVTRDRSSPTVPRKGSSGRRSSLETLSVIYGSLTCGHQDRKNTMKQIQIASETFKMISSHSDVDHPLCLECPEAILDMYDQEIAEMEKAQQQYNKMCQQLHKEVKDYETEPSELDAELIELRKMESELTTRLKTIEEQRTKIAAERKIQDEREVDFKGEEDQYWRDFNQYQQRMLECKDDQISMQYQVHYATEQLAKLKKTNVLNKTFHIWHNGHFGTINGLRLGRLQTVPVEWVEINAAWGQSAFLLSTLARFTGVVFENYALIPYGNQSFLEPLEGKRKLLPLYSSAGLRFFTDSKFDAAMVAFLDCLNQFKMHIESTSQPHFVLPYAIDKDKIGDASKEFYSIKTQFNTQEKWTKALKFMLTNLRWALTWVAANCIHNSSEK